MPLPIAKVGLLVLFSLTGPVHIWSMRKLEELGYQAVSLRPWQCVLEGMRFLRGQYGLWLKLTFCWGILGLILFPVFGALVGGLLISVDSGLKGRKVWFSDVWEAASGFGFLRAFVGLGLVYLMVGLYADAGMTSLREAGIEGALFPLLGVGGAHVGAVVLFPLHILLRMLILLWLGLALNFIWDHQTSFRDAVWLSLIVLFDRALGFIGLALLFWGMTALGGLVFGFGIVFVVPLQLVCFQFAWRRIFPR